MDPITLEYGRYLTDGTVDGDTLERAQAIPTTDGYVYWPLVRFPQPIIGAPKLFCKMPAGYTLVHATGINAELYPDEFVNVGGSCYEYEPPVVRAHASEPFWIMTLLAEPPDRRNTGAITLRYGRFRTGGVDDDQVIGLDGEQMDRAFAMATTEGNVFWQLVPFKQTKTGASTIYFELPDEYEIVEVYDHNGIINKDSFVKQPDGCVYHYHDANARPIAYEQPLYLTILCEPPSPVDVNDNTPHVIVIGEHGYCTVSAVMRAAGVADAIAQDIRQFIYTGFKHINAQINLTSREIKLVPPITDQDIIDVLERLNIDFAAGRFLLSRGDSDFAEKFIARFDRNLEKIGGKLTKGTPNDGKVEQAQTILGPSDW